MKLFLAMDLRQNLVVHGKSGQRTTYKPLDWGISPTAEPLGFIESIRPRFLYIADLDRIERTGSHDAVVRDCAQNVSKCFIDRGCRSPSDFLEGENIVNIVGTETGGRNMREYHGGVLSIDVKDGRVEPCGKKPVDIMAMAQHWDFEGAILLNISAVGTESGIDKALLENMRRIYDRPLFYGGGVATVDDLEIISQSGFDGAIVSTALHRGIIPIEWIRRGTCC